MSSLFVRGYFELRNDNCGWFDFAHHRFGIARFVRPADFWRDRLSAPETHPPSAEIDDWGGAAGTEANSESGFCR